jgi:hypothetical protein
MAFAIAAHPGNLIRRTRGMSGFVPAIDFRELVAPRSHKRLG